MTIALRPLLARLCSPDTMSRIVDPVLADMRFESSRPAWRGYLSLARALALHAIVSTPAAAVRMCSDDDFALPRATVACALITAVLSVPLIASPMISMAWLNPWRAIRLLAPQALVLALPASLLVAIPLAFRHTTERRHLVLRALALSIGCAAITLVLMTRVMPDANQAFRIDAANRLPNRPIHLERGPSEMTLGEMRERIELLRLTPGGVKVARRLEYTYQMKLALALLPISLGAFAMAIAVSKRGKARPVLIGAGSLIIYILVTFPIDAVSVKLLDRSVAIPPTALAWAPTFLILATAIAVANGSRDTSVNACR